jgi:hypothetical protein
MFGALTSEARKFLNKAVENRERFYRGLDEAVQRYRAGGNNVYALAGTETSAKLKAAQTDIMKTAIADNKWHMQQSMMYSALATAEATNRLVEEQRRTNALLERLLENNHG